jgi:hypothetical protein
MECTALAANLGSQAPGGGAAASRCDAASRFAELVQTELVQNNPQVGGVYVDMPAGSDGANPLVAVMSKFQSLDLPSPLHRQAESSNATGYGGHDNDRPSGEGEQASPLGEEIVGAQVELVRTMLMLETLNTSKQGITTLFQQQG